MQALPTLKRLFSHSFAKKIFLGAFLGSHFPLVTMMILILSEHGGLHQNLDILLPLLIATFIGSLATIAFIAAMLRPIQTIADQMKVFENTGALPDLPINRQDELGYLMRRTNELCYDMRAKFEHIHGLAHIDPLTQALNRRGFEAATQDRVRGAILALDIDHFKTINDTHGHGTGDDVLVEVVKTARGHMRETDLICRSGGEEFLIYLKDLNRKNALTITERIRRSIEQGVKLSEGSVTVSIGVLWTKSVMNAQDAIKLADVQLNRAKAQGRNRVLLAEPQGRAA